MGNDCTNSWIENCPTLFQQSRQVHHAKGKPPPRFHNLQDTDGLHRTSHSPMQEFCIPRGLCGVKNLLSPKQPRWASPRLVHLFPGPIEAFLAKSFQATTGLQEHIHLLRKPGSWMKLILSELLIILFLDNVVSQTRKPAYKIVQTNIYGAADLVSNVSRNAHWKQTYSWWMEVDI